MSVFLSPPSAQLSDRELQLLILKCLLPTDRNGNLTEIRQLGAAKEHLKTELNSRGHHQSAKTVWDKHYSNAISGKLAQIVFPGASGSRASLDERSEKLRELYGLVELIVVPSNADERPSQDQQFSNLGKAAARLFEHILARRTRYLTIGIGGGQTMHELVAHLPRLKDPFTIVATNFATRAPVDKTYDSSYLAMQVHWQSIACKANICSLPPLPDDDSKSAVRMHQSTFVSNGAVRQIFEESKQPDVVFVGVGDFNRTSLVIERVYRHLGLDADSLNEFRPLGDINLCIFDKEGNDLTSLITRKRLGIKAGTLFPDDPLCHPFLVGLSMDCFRALVHDKSKKVIVVAGGAEKAEAIHALLNAKVKCMNGLVTDENTLERLLELSESKRAS